MPINSIGEAEAIVGGLSKPSKMPGYAYGLPASRCKVGSVLAKIPGSVCANCYALKGRYVFPNVLAAQERRFQTLTHPEWVDAMVYLITKREVQWFRWHDSGDIQDERHLQMIVDVATQCPKTQFWLPTRENKLVAQYINSGATVPKNLVIRVSGAMIDGAQPLRFVNTSTVVSSDATCPAPKQGGKCGDCRACWDRRVVNVSYKKH